MRPAEQRRCTHASLSCTIAAGPHENKPWQSKQLACAAIAPVVLNSAIASAATSVNPATAVHTSYAPPSSDAAPTHRYRVQSPQGPTKTSRGRANSSRARQLPRSCLIQQLPAPPHLRIQRQLCTHHTPRRAVPLHPRIIIVYKHRRVTRKQAAAEQTARVRGNSSGRA
jgi:hypothetical protein